MLLGFSLPKFFLSFSFQYLVKACFVVFLFVAYCSNFVCPDPFSSVHVYPASNFLFYGKRFPLVWIVENAFSFGWKSLFGWLYLKGKIHLS